MWTIHLPLRVQVSKKSAFLLNLNHYRNTHFQVLNKAKITFEEVVRPHLKVLPKLGKCRLTYTLFPATKQLSDVSNICSIVDKFFSDTLTSNGYIEDDNYTVIPEVHYLFGSVDPDNPRVECLIEPLEETQPMPEKEDPMQIILVQSEVEQALHDYISSRLTLAEGTTIKIDLSATRGADGIKATIDLVAPGSAPVALEAPAPAPTKPTKSGKEDPKVTPAPAPAAAPQEPANDAQPDAGDPPFVADAPAAEAGVDPVADQIAAEAAGEASAPAPKSLFASIKRPQNT